MPINIPLSGKIRRKMGSKDVRTDSGSSQPSEAGVHLRFPCCRGKTYSGFAEDLPFPGGEVQNGWDSFRTWKRETQKQESKISGTVSTLPGTPDSL